MAISATTMRPASKSGSESRNQVKRRVDLVSDQCCKCGKPSVPSSLGPWSGRSRPAICHTPTTAAVRVRKNPSRISKLGRAYLCDFAYPSFTRRGLLLESFQRRVIIVGLCSAPSPTWRPYSSVCICRRSASRPFPTIDHRPRTSASVRSSVAGPELH